jgi:hypothetical protein
MGWALFWNFHLCPTAPLLLGILVYGSTDIERKRVHGFASMGVVTLTQGFYLWLEARMSWLQIRYRWRIPGQLTCVWLIKNLIIDEGKEAMW